MVRFKRLDATISSGLIPLAQVISNYVIPLALAAAVVKILIYLFIKDWNLVLLKAASDGELSILNEAIRKKGNLEATQGENEVTPLMLATINNHNAILSALISAGANVDARDAEGRVALMYAAQKGFIDIVQILLAKGSDSNSKGYDGTSALILAARKYILTIRFSYSRNYSHFNDDMYCCDDSYLW
jgi:ankyrin repeat protein